MNILLWAIGIFITCLIYFLQKQKGRFEISIDIEKKPLENNRNSVYANQDAELEIDVITKVKSNYSRPVSINSFFIAVPKIQWLYMPYWITIYWSAKRHIPIKFPGLELPIKIEPEETMNEQYLTGFEIANYISKKKYKGEINVLIGFFDENKNVYYSHPFTVDIEEWETDRGNSFITFLA